MRRAKLEGRASDAGRSISIVQLSSAIAIAD
jgi:hypothetical protein